MKLIRFLLLHFRISEKYDLMTVSNLAKIFQATLFASHFDLLHTSTRTQIVHSLLERGSAFISAIVPELVTEEADTILVLEEENIPASPKKRKSAFGLKFLKKLFRKQGKPVVDISATEPSANPLYEPVDENDSHYSYSNPLYEPLTVVYQNPLYVPRHAV